MDILIPQSGRGVARIALVLALLVPSLAATAPSPGPGPAEAGRVSWNSLPSLPDKFGFAGMYAGVSGGALIAAGGANFSEKPHAEGGRKIWHDRIFALAAPDGPWREVGRLPRPAAYGMSATWRDAVVCVGGGDAGENFAEAWLMRWDGRAIHTEPLPALPTPLANATGMLIGDVLYIIGGRDGPDSPSPLAQMLSLDLAGGPEARQWHREPWPADAVGRFFSVLGVHEGELFVFSGTALTTGPGGELEYHYLTDAYAFRPGRGWRRLAEMPYATAAAATPAISLAPATFLILSGVNAPWGTPTGPGPGGATPGFSRRILAYDIDRDAWRLYAEHAVMPDAPPTRVTAPLVRWHGHNAVINGEIAPGIRTPTVLSLDLADPAR